MSTGAFVAGGIRGTKEQDGRTAGRQEEEGGGQNSHAVPVIPSGGGRRWRWRLWWVCEGGGGDVNVSKRRKKVKEAGKQEVRMRVRCGGGVGAQNSQSDDENPVAAIPSSGGRGGTMSTSVGSERGSNEQLGRRRRAAMARQVARGPGERGSSRVMPRVMLGRRRTELTDCGDDPER